MRGNKDLVVVYEKLDLPETMLVLLRLNLKTTAEMMQESVFSTPVSGLFKVESPSL